MTQEEKARAYDEALKRADSLTEKYGGREFAEYVFPELNESDDERIRKKIIENVRLSGGYTDEEIDEMISWLEKQKDQKPAEWSEEDKMPMPEDTVIFQKGVAEGRRLEREDGGLAWRDIKSIVQIADKMLDDPKARVEFQNHNEKYYYKRVLDEYKKTKEGRR